MDFPVIKGDVIKCTAVFLLLLAHLISSTSFVFVMHIFVEHFHVNYILKILLPLCWNIDMITLLLFPFHEVAKIKPMQLNLTFQLSKWGSYIFPSPTIWKTISFQRQPLGKVSTFELWSSLFKGRKTSNFTHLDWKFCFQSLMFSILLPHGLIQVRWLD